MDRQTLARTPKPGDRADQKRAKPRAQAGASIHPLLTLQRSVGNQAMQRLVQSPRIQAQLRISPEKKSKEPAVQRSSLSPLRQHPQPNEGFIESRRPLRQHPEPDEKLNGSPSLLPQPKELAAPAAPSAKTSAMPEKTAGPAPESAPSSDKGESAAPGPAASAGEHAVLAEDKPAGGAEGKAGAAETEAAEAKGQAKPAAKGEAPVGEAAPASAAGAAVAVKLHMPEPPSGPSPGTMKRIGGVQQRAGGTAAAKAALPASGTQVGAARQAVDQPDAEAKAHAQADLMAMLGDKAAPSPEIVKLCERIRKVIREKRPPDEDALMEAKPEGEALNAGNQLNSTVEGETKKVQDNYSAIDNPPAGAPPAKGQELPGQPDAAATPAVNAKAATPDPVPADNVSLDADAEASKKKIQDAGMETPAAQLIQAGPVAEARSAQGELDQAAKEDPAKVLAGQKEALAKAEDNMAVLQQEALAALMNSRAATTKGATSQQQGMVLTEEAKRTKASAEAQQIFTDAQKDVTVLLKPLASNAIDEWEAAKTLLVAQFKADLSIVQERVKERHAGVGGFVVGLWDAVTGLPGWAIKAYDAAELNFADGVIAKITEISVKVNTVIATCELLIKTARDRIAKIFSELGGSLTDWAAEQQAKFDGQLDKLHDQAIATRDNFNKDLMDRSKEAVDEVRAEISELRKKAGGLVGRIVSAINRFIEDPVKFIIEGLLELLGIPPAAFWAVVAKIKKVIKDIADDPLKFASNLLEGLAAGFGKFFDNFGTHLLKGFLTWLLGDIKGVQIPKDVSVKSIITFFLQLMGITWPNIRKILVKLIGAKNVALIEKVYSLVSMLMEKGPEGIYEMIREKLDPQSIVDQVVQLAVDFMVSAIIKQVTARIIALFNPVGAIVQALEAIYRVLKWIFQNAAKIFTLVETVVNGIGDILAGNTGGFAAAVDKALGMLIAPVIAFIADYLSLGDLPSIIAEKIKSMREWILGLIETALTWIVEKGKALLAAIGIGKKDEKKDDKGGTPHEQAVHAVATTLAQPVAGEPLGYKEPRAAKEKEADSLVAIHNDGLATEHVKMSVKFADPASDEDDQDLDFTVVIAPNNTDEKGAVALAVPEPIAGPHRVERKAPPFSKEAEQSHHVPAKALGKGVALFLSEAAQKLGGKDWKDVPYAATIGNALRKRAGENEKAADPGDGLSAILLSEKAHKGDSGAHSKLNAGKVLKDIDENPALEKIALVKRQTANEIGVYISVNPRTTSWRDFLDDAWEAINNPDFKAKPDQPKSAKNAVELILSNARKKFVEAESTSEAFLQVHVVDAVNQVIDEGVGQAYTRGKGPVASGMKSAKFGTAAGREKALGDLDGYFASSWQQFRDPIDV